MKRLRLALLAFGFCLAVGLPLAAMAGPIPNSTPDADGDGIEDDFDNCTAAKNPTQADTDHDGCGQFCDFDFNNDGSVVKNGDVALAATQVGKLTCGPTGAPPCPGPPYNCCACDFNQDGVCKGGELAAISASIGKKPGPSGMTNAVCDPTKCGCTPAP